VRSSRTDFYAKGEALQDLDHVSIMKPITRFAATVSHTQRIPEIISMVFREAYNGRPVVPGNSV
jgi:thiamine pyrophosphate-dependent acetolactate synthase large subunit-like protein